MRIWHVAIRVKDDVEWNDDNEAAGQIAAAIAAHLKRGGVEIAQHFGKPAVYVRPSCDRIVRPGQPWRCSLAAGHSDHCVSEDGHQSTTFTRLQRPEGATA